MSNLGIQQGSFTVKNCTFSKNHKGIVSTLCSSFLIQDNQFEMDQDEDPTYFNDALPIGKSCAEILAEAQGFTVSGNTFACLADEVSEDCSYYGTICTNTGQGLGKEIINNDYAYMEVSNAARYNNGDEENGLVYLCNNHLAEPPGFENCVDLLIEPEATIRKEQHGTGQQGAATPAGNIFSSSDPIENRSGAEDPDDFYEFNYYYALSDSSQNPGSPDGVTPIGLDALPNCGEADCPPPCPVPLPGLKALFWDAQAQVDTLQALARGRNEQPALERAARYWEQQRRRAAGQILRHYALDTAALQVDSIRQWLSNANTFGSLYLLARQAFFFGNMPDFRKQWARIPQRVDLTPYQAKTYARLSGLFDTLQPFLSKGGVLRELPGPLIEALLGFSTGCNEAGFLAVALLQRNGLEATVPCNGQNPAIAPNNKRNRQAQAPHLRNSGPRGSLFPNPTRSTLQVVLPSAADAAFLTLCNVQGQVVFQAPLTGQRTILQLPVPAGIYWARLQIKGRHPEYHKIIVSR